MQWFDLVLLVFVGGVTGLIDSIAGGGGLISLPFLTLFLSPGAEAIGTNKIIGSTAALVAFGVYSRSHQFDLRKSLVFTIWIGVGSLFGSLLTPILPKEAFRWILLLSCPLVFWVVARKSLWAQRLAHDSVDLDPHSQKMKLALIGLACGFYDGAWGPGAGTFMLLALVFVAKLPLLGALAASKLANSCSALVALTSYGLQGYVHWFEGSIIALGIGVGAFFGAKLATQNAARIIRPVLLGVSSLLILRLLF